MTLNEIINKNPELGDLEIVVYSTDGTYYYVSDGAKGSGTYYKSRDDWQNKDVLVFSAD